MSAVGNIPIQLQLELELLPQRTAKETYSYFSQLSTDQMIGRREKTLIRITVKDGESSKTIDGIFEGVFLMFAGKHGALDSPLSDYLLGFSTKEGEFAVRIGDVTDYIDLISQ